MTARDDDSVLLRRALLGNALFSGPSGMLLLLFAPEIGAWIGVRSPGLLRLVGALLILFAVDLAHQSRREVMVRARAVVASLSDLAWVAASGVLVVRHPELLSGAGRALVIAVAAVVLLFAALQLAGLGRLTGAGGAREG